MYCENCIHRAFVDHRRHVGIFSRITELDFFHAGFQLFQERVVDALIHNSARTCRALLPLKAERGLCDTFHRRINIGIGINDDSVLAAHFENGALDPHLAGRLRGCALIDVQSDFARAGESNVAGLGVRDYRSCRNLHPRRGRN